MDPDPAPDLAPDPATDPALFVSDLQDAAGTFISAFKDKKSLRSH
jgi:hypothetical protein